MDPLSQAVLGASLSQSFAKNKRHQRHALIIGALAGMAPDLDVLIRSAGDPMLFLEFHRQFTHSLVFIPFGALLCAVFFYPWFKAGLSFTQVYRYSLLGFATHGLLDACTSYGTQLFWPFSTMRIAWNMVSIIDPLFTLPLLILVLLAAYKKKPRYAQWGFVYAVLFLSLGVLQKSRVENALINLATLRGHKVERMHVKPGFANRHVWKMIYQYNGRYYVDAVKLLWQAEYIEGTSIQKLDIKRDFPQLPKNSQQAKDIERFRWFSDNFLAVNPQNPDYIMDVRYSFLPNSISAMWGVVIDRKNTSEHVRYEINSRPDKATLKRYFEMVF